MFHNMICFYGEKLLAPCPSPKLEDHPCGLSMNAYSIYLQLPSILEAIRPPQPKDASCRGERDPIIMV